MIVEQTESLRTSNKLPLRSGQEERDGHKEGKRDEKRKKRKTEKRVLGEQKDRQKERQRQATSVRMLLLPGTLVMLTKCLDHMETTL